MKLIAFAASSNTASINKVLVSYAASLLENAETEVLDLNDYEIPLFSEDKEQEIGQPQLAKNFLAKLESADAIVVAFAEHNGSYTTAYKNLLDWVSRINQQFFLHKPVGFMATSLGPGGASSVLSTAVTSAPFFGAKVVAQLSIPSFHQNFDQNQTHLHNPALKQQLTSAMNKLAAAIEDA